MFNFYATCPWHPNKHTFKECPARCKASNDRIDRSSRGLRYVTARWRCRSRVNQKTGKCQNGHVAFTPKPTNGGDNDGTG